MPFLKFLGAVVFSAVLLTSVFIKDVSSQAVDSPGEIPNGRCIKLLGKDGSYKNRSGVTANEYVLLGESSRGRRIVAEHWGNREGPQVLVIGQVHGNECTPAILVNELRRHPSTEVGMWIIPTLNPDGLARHARKIATGIDLKRDGFRRKAIETRLLFSFIERYKPVMSIHVHSPNGWVGHFNGDLAREVCRDIARRSDLRCRNAGRVGESGSAFLWEGLARHVRGHQSVLIELPRTSSREASSTPRQWVVQASRVEVKNYAKQIRLAIDKTVSGIK